MKNMYSEGKIGAGILVEKCGALKGGEHALILSDRVTHEVGELLKEKAQEITEKVEHRCFPMLSAHGVEPSRLISDEMEKADVIFCLTSFSLAHTQARKKATDKGARFLSLPDYSLELLASPSVRTDYESHVVRCDKLAEILSRGKEVKVSSPLGTNLLMDISGRKANSSPGICRKPGCLASPPDIETNIAPLEEFSSGVVIIDGSVPYPGLGLLKGQITLTLEKGRIVSFTGKNGYVLRLKEVIEKRNSPKAYVLGELGIGLNPDAKLSGRMLEDEGCLGTIHLGFGSNSTIGGENTINFHIDMVMRNAVLMVDGEEIVEGGRLYL